MATQSPELLGGGEKEGGGRGVASAAGVALSSSAFRAAVAISEEKSSSPILVFLYFHKAVRNELDLLYSSAMDFATGQPSDLSSLRKRYHFLRLIYKHHCDAEEEVIFSALDKRVKNVVLTYSLEHKSESNLFDHLFELLTSSSETDESFPKELAFCAGALRTSVSQHLAKEEKQVFPLLVEKFSHAEQAFIVWRFLCSIPVNMLAEFLPWISSSISADECMEMRKCLWKIVPDEKLLQQVVHTWMERENGRKGLSNLVDEGCLRSCAQVSTCRTGGSQNACELSKTRKRKYQESTKFGCNDAQRHPIDEILLWHNAISKELNEIVREARKIQKMRDFSDISVFDERLQFISEVCIYRSIARDKILYPTGSKELSSSQERDEEENQFNKIRCLIESIKGAGAAASTSELYTKVCPLADQIMKRIQKHFYKEEVQLLPLTRKPFSFKRQQELLYQSLCLMPLRLIERVLPWLVASLTEDEARNFLTNLQEGAPPTDACLVTLFSGWACKGLHLSRTENGCYPVKSSKHIEGSVSNHGCQREMLIELDHSVSGRKRNGSNSLESINRPPSGNGCVPGLGINSNSLGLSYLSAAKSIRSPSLSSAAPSLSSSLFIWGTDSNNSTSGNSERPIDTIFKFHKAISKDLEYLDVESGKLMDCDETFLRQFILRFHLLWGFYKAHSSAEDEIVFPALESKETLHNVSHSYTLDHKHEEKLFEDIYAVLSELSVLHENTCKDSMMEGLPETGTISADTSSSNCKKRYNDLTTKLQGMCKSIKITLDQHIFLEELELWPLFDKHFSIEEQDEIVGHIIGTTGAEVLQSMLPWVTSALTHDEQNSMMDTWKQATKNTMFDEWLSECWKDQPHSSSSTETSKAALLGDEDLHEFLDQNDKMFKPGWKDIFRMNQNELEAEIRKVYRDLTLDPRRKAYLVQNLMTSRWIAAQQKLPQTAATSTSDSDIASDCCPSFQDPEKQVFGCEHYKRNCKLVAACCGRLFTCRFCHDKVSDHSMDRKATSEMMCMRCLKVQPIGPVCSTPSCNGFSMAMYYCNICKLFEDERSVYHCPFCNLCRVGKGLGIDYFHCMTCNCCLGMKLVNHKCLEKSLETNCPICCEFLFTSSEAVRALPCGHYMHSACFQAYTCSHYTCPICFKSLGDMGVYFGMLDALLATEELPDEYKNRCQDILCNDCERKGNSRFHWLYHKCGFCGSYNTRVIKTDTTPAPICSTST